MSFRIQRRVQYLLAIMVFLAAISLIHIFNGYSAINLKAQLTPAIIEREEYSKVSAAAGGGFVKRFPHAIIIGAKKCGTTAMKSMLKRHPQIASAGEVHYFDNGKDHYLMGPKWYLNKMPQSDPQQITMEKSPKYFITPEAPERIHAMNASILLILTVRNPVVRLLSDFMHQTDNDWYGQSSEHSLNIEEEVLTVNQELNTTSSIVVPSLYPVHFSRWLQTFRREQILVVDGDRFTTGNPAAVLQEIENFLQIDPWFTSDSFFYNSNKGHYSMRIDKGIDKGQSFGMGRPKQYVEPWLLDKLSQLFEPYNQEFYKLVGREFNWTTPDFKLYTGNVTLNKHSKEKMGKETMDALIKKGVYKAKK